MKSLSYLDLKVRFEVEGRKMSLESLGRMLDDCRRLRSSTSHVDESRDLSELIDEIEIEVAERNIEAANEREQRDIFGRYVEFIKPTDDLILTVSNFKSGSLLREVERELISQCLNHFDWDRSQAARTLGITENSLRRKLEQYYESGELLRNYEISRLC